MLNGHALRGAGTGEGDIDLEPLVSLLAGLLLAVARKACQLPNGRYAVGVARVIVHRDGRQLLQHHGGELAGLDLELLPTLRSEEHTSELRSRGHLVCRLLLEIKKACSKYFGIVITVLKAIVTSNNRNNKTI